MTTRSAGLAFTILLAGVTPGRAQHQPAPPKQNQFSVDVGILEAGVTFARRLGRGAVSLGAGLSASYEPRTSFDENLYLAAGGDLFVRLHAHRLAHLELGPSLLWYSWDDDCSGCNGTFVGARAAAMFGKGMFWAGPTARFGRLSGGRSGPETGLIWGIQGRLLFSWGAPLRPR